MVDELFLVEQEASCQFQYSHENPLPVPHLIIREDCLLSQPPVFPTMAKPLDWDLDQHTSGNQCRDRRMFDKYEVCP